MVQLEGQFRESSFSSIPGQFISTKCKTLTNSVLPILNSVLRHGVKCVVTTRRLPRVFFTVVLTKEEAKTSANELGCMIEHELRPVEER